MRESVTLREDRRFLTSAKTPSAESDVAKGIISLLMNLSTELKLHWSTHPSLFKAFFSLSLQAGKEN